MAKGMAVLFVRSWGCEIRTAVGAVVALVGTSFFEVVPYPTPAQRSSLLRRRYCIL